MGRTLRNREPAFQLKLKVLTGNTLPFHNRQPVHCCHQPPSSCVTLLCEGDLAVERRSEPHVTSPEERQPPARGAVPLGKRSLLQRSTRACWAPPGIAPSRPQSGCSVRQTH